MADNEEKPIGRFGYAVDFVYSLPNRFRGRNSPSLENDQKSKSDDGDSIGRELSSTHTENDFVALKVLQDSFEYLEKQVPLDDGHHSIDFNRSNPLSSSRTDQTLSLSVQAWSVDKDNLNACLDLVSSKLDNTSYLKSKSSSSSRRRREVQLDIRNATPNACTMSRSQTLIYPPDEHKEADKNHGHGNEGIIKTLRNNDLALPVMMASFTLLFGLLTFHKLNDMSLGMIIFMQLLFISGTGLFIGIVLHEIYPLFADKIKLVGYGCFFSGFFGTMASFLGLYLGVIPIICAIFIIVPLLMALFNML